MVRGPEERPFGDGIPNNASADATPKSPARRRSKPAEKRRPNSNARADDSSGQRRAQRGPSGELQPPTLITETAQLVELVERLSTEPIIAVDTEADSFFSYAEKVCLIQISNPVEDFIVDPLSPALELEPLGALLADERCTKIFHDGEFDVLILKRHAGFEFKGLFDTRVAAAALGLDTLGLAPLLEAEFDLQLDKTQQMSDWGRRPLTPAQLAYARLDTRYLIELATRMHGRLEEAQRLEIVAGECRRLEALEPPRREFNPDEFIRLKGARNLDRVQLSVLRELFCTRDRLASEQDRPPFKIVAHNVLVEIARRRPRHFEALTDVQGVSFKQAKRIGDALIGAVRTGLEAGPLESIPRLPSKDGTDGLDEAGVELYERLKTTRKKLGEKEGLDTSLVLNRKVLIRLALERPEGLEALGDVDGMQPWQVELFGSSWIETIQTFNSDLEAGRVEFGARRRRGRRP